MTVPTRPLFLYRKKVKQILEFKHRYGIPRFALVLLEDGKKRLCDLNELKLRPYGSVTKRKE